MSDFGELLDEVLREAANLPPLVGMERRLVAGLPRGPKSVGRGVWVGVAAAAAFLIAVATWPSARPRPATLFLASQRIETRELASVPMVAAHRKPSLRRRAILIEPLKIEPIVIQPIEIAKLEGRTR